MHKNEVSATFFFLALSVRIDFDVMLVVWRSNSDYKHHFDDRFNYRSAITGECTCEAIGIVKNYFDNFLLSGTRPVQLCIRLKR